MIIDITLVIVFLASAGALVFLISRRAAALTDVSEMTVFMYYEERFGRILRLYRRVYRFFKEGKYKEKTLEYSCRVLHRMHILLMRADNGIVSLLKKVRARAGFNGKGGVSEDSHTQ